MKKTLIALLVAGAATSANAAVELVKNEQLYVGVQGGISAFAYASEVETKTLATGAKVSNTNEPKINLSAKAQFDFGYQVNPGLLVGGTFEIQNKSSYNSSSNDAEFDDVAAFLKGDFGLVGIGEIGDVSDSNNAVSKTDILNELPNDFLPLSASDSNAKAISYTYDFGNVEFVADAYTDESESVDNKYGLSLNYAGDNYSVGAMYQYWGTGDLDGKGFIFQPGGASYAGLAPVASDYKNLQSAAVSADLNLGKLTLASAVNYISEENNVSKNFETVNLTASALYPMTEKATVYGVYGFRDSNHTGYKRSNYLVLGSEYAVAPMFTLFTEIAGRDYHLGTTEKQTAELLVGGYFDF